MIITRLPPRIVQTIPTYVPTVDADGNETSGVPSVLHQAPLGTYLGWNIAGGGFFAGADLRLSGRLRAVRGDEGRAREDRRSAAVGRRTLRHARRLRLRGAAGRRRGRPERFLLRENADRLVRDAERSGVLPAEA